MKAMTSLGAEMSSITLVEASELFMAWCLVRGTCATLSRLRFLDLLEIQRLYYINNDKPIRVDPLPFGL